MANEKEKQEFTFKWWTKWKFVYFEFSVMSCALYEATE